MDLFQNDAQSLVLGIETLGYNKYMDITAQRIAILTVLLVLVIALTSLVYRITPVKTLDYQGFLKGISNGGLHLDLQGGGK